MKKILSVLLVLFMILSVSACSYGGVWQYIDTSGSSDTESIPTENTPVGSEPAESESAENGDGSNTNTEPEQKPTEALSSSYAGVWECGLNKEYKVVIQKIAANGTDISLCVDLGNVSDNFVGKYENGVISFCSEYWQRSGKITVGDDVLTLDIEEWNSKVELEGKSIDLQLRPKLYKGSFEGDSICGGYFQAGGSSYDLERPGDYKLRVIFYSDTEIDYVLRDAEDGILGGINAEFTDGKWIFDGDGWLDDMSGILEFRGNGVVLNVENGSKKMLVERGIYYFENDNATGVLLLHGNSWEGMRGYWHCNDVILDITAISEGKGHIETWDGRISVDFTVKNGSYDSCLDIYDAGGNKIGKMERGYYRHHPVTSENNREESIRLTLYTEEDGIQTTKVYRMYMGDGAKG